MSELSFSLTDCAVIPQASEMVIPSPELQETAVITVEETENQAYTIVEAVARHFRGWITVAQHMARTLIAKIHAMVRAIPPQTGVQILRQSAILII